MVCRLRLSLIGNRYFFKIIPFKTFTLIGSLTSHQYMYYKKSKTNTPLLKSYDNYHSINFAAICSFYSTESDQLRSLLLSLLT